MGKIEWIAGAVVCLALGASVNAYAQVTNVDDQVTALLKAVGPVPFTHPVAQDYYLRDENHPLCDNQQPFIKLPPGGPLMPNPRYVLCNAKRTRTVNVTDSAVLTASNVTLTFSDNPSFGAAVQTALPADVTSWNQDLLNCTASSGSITVTISKQVQHTVTGTVTKQLALTEGASLEVSGGFGPFASVKAGLSISHTATTINATANANADVDTRTGMGSVSVPAMSKTEAQFSVWPVIYTLPFTLQATVDGDLSPNDKGWRRLSDVLGADKRTLQVAGSVTVTEASDGVLKFVPVTIASGECPAAATGLSASPPQLQSKGSLATQ
jgi:hypothetical protein